MSEIACTSCGTANETDARFCEGCGAALDRRCAACGTQASATARFCRSCGGSLGGPTEPALEAPTRKTVTVLFADLAGSTTFEEKVDAETAREVLGDYHKLLRVTADQHRAGTVKYIGDGFMAVWGVPEVSAADADHAVDAAVELQERFVDLAARVAETHGEDLALRVAVNTGEVVVGAGDADLVGDALNVAARLESECPHGRVVVGEETWRATRGRYRYEPLNRVQVKGRAAPVAVYQWVGRRSEPPDSVPFVGRAHEFRRVQAVLEDAVARRAARLVTVIGDPGVGKTRLAAEFSAGQRDAEVLQIRCAAEGTVALAPVVEALRPRDLDVDLPATVPERDRILRDLNGMTGGVAGSVEETFWGLRRYFEVLAARGRLILVLDDVQWADALLLDFVEHLSEWVRDAPILMIALARPELRETRPELVTVGGWVGDAIRLGGLEPGATAELANRVLGRGQLPTELLARLPSSTGGNPLFVRELVAMLVHDGVLVAEADGWRLTIDVDAIDVPPTIQALLASRLERMNSSDRRVLETASVIGTDFSPAAVCALSGAGAAEVKASLDRLRRLELAQPSGAYIGDDPVWRFHHILIRDVAYRRLLKSDRAELHERFGDWIQTDGRTGVFESDELLARHLESAYRYRCELGARDSGTSELALRSARCYLSAARRALDRDALVSAGAQAARGAALAAADAALQAELLLVGCEAYLSAGDVAAGAPLVDELDRVADDGLAPWATCYRCQYIVYTDPSRLPDIDERLQPVIDEFARRGDAGGSAKAYRVRASARGRLGRIGDAEADLFEALIAARKVGDHRQITAALGAAPSAALWGPSPAPKAGGRCLDVVRMQRMTTAAPSLEATSLRCLAVLELLRGRPDKARSMLADAREIVAELGLRHGLMETELFAGIIESMVGDPVAAEPHFRTALEGLDSLGVGADAGQAAALLARSLLAQGRIDEADRYATESERIAGHNLKTAIGWRAVRAEILSAQGRHRDAVAKARDAVDIAADTDLVLDYADACLTLSRVLAESGDRQRAAEARRKAESLYAAKDAVFLVGTSSQRADPPAAPAPPAETSGRLNVVNRACDIVLAGWQSLQLEYTEGFVYDDHRKVSGEPLHAPDDYIAAALRKQEQYPHVEATVLAVRGQTLAFIALRWWDDAGNETMSLDLYEIDESDRLGYHGRFDEDDFAGAYRTLEERYYAGAGAPFAANGMKVFDFEEAIWAQDIEAARQAVQPNFRWCAAASALKPDERSLEELFAWRAKRLAQVASFRVWLAALRWLSPEVCVSLCEIRATGRDGEQYRWNRFHVNEYRNGLSASVREFDIDDEDEAFAYAESLVARDHCRLVVRNQASAAGDGIIKAVRSKDSAGAAALFADGLNYDDRRRLGGNAITSRRDYQRSLEQLVQQYSRSENQTLAVRGEQSALVSSRHSDAAGNEAAYLHVFELDDSGLICYEGRFDEDDFLSAYVELDRRYYAGEGAAFAESGRAAAGWVEGIGRRDIEMVRRFSTPDFRWIAAPSSLKAPERTVEDMFEWMHGRGEQVTSQRHWESVIKWVSPGCAVGLVEIAAVGPEGDEYRWNYIVAAQVRDGLLSSIREFDTEDEAFGYAESIANTPPRRLALVNRASKVGHRGIASFQAGDLDAVIDAFSDDSLYDDRRRLGGDSVVGRSSRRSAVERIAQQFSRFELQTLAVRGDLLHLASYRWSDPSGNETQGLILQEVNDDGLVVYDSRFDEDDFASAYLELERRYWNGEGAPFAEASVALSQVLRAESRGDLDSAFTMFAVPGLRIESRSRSIFPTRTPAELRKSLEELGTLVGPYQVWSPAVHWLSPEWVVARHHREAVGADGQRFTWSRLYAAHIRNGLMQSVCEFDVEDEDRAIAYAEECMRAKVSRLAVSNKASEVRVAGSVALQNGDIDSASSLFSEHVVLEDRRRMSGEPPAGGAGVRAALEKLRNDYSHFDGHFLAVRGDSLVLARYVCSDEGGNQTSGLSLTEIGADGRVVFEVRFDEDDFETAYLELERRYYAGEGAAFAEAGATMTEVVTVGNRGHVDKVFDELFEPEMQVESRSRTIIPSRTLDEYRASVHEFRSMVRSSRSWYASVCWLSPTFVVALQEREAIGLEGQKYEWTRIYALEIHDGRFTAGCEFDTEFEDEAFEYADERVRASTSRLAVANRASAVGERLARAIRAGDLDRALAQFSSEFEHEDHRRLRGDPIVGHTARRAALERILQQYNRLEMSPLAVRGDRLVLERVCRSDDSGNESTVLVLGQTGDDDRLVAYIVFDEDDFDSAYAEMEQRYYAGEGADTAAAGATMTAFVTALNGGGMEQAFELVNNADLMIETRSRAVFPDRTASELREDLELLVSMTSSVRWWYSAVQWLSPTCCVVRREREATGGDDERYAWADIYAVEFRGAVPVWVCRFNLEDEEQAFAAAGERIRLQCSRLAVSNRATEIQSRGFEAIQRGDVDAAASAYADDLVYDDRRRLSGESIVGPEGMRAAFIRLRNHYSHFGGEILAVRGDRLGLGSYSCSDDDGNQTAGLLLVEINEDDRICFEGRFDEDDFETAYSELERRHYAGDGAPFADYGMTMANYFVARNRGDLDTLFNSLTSPDLRLESRSNSVFVVRSAAEHRASIEELARLVGSVRDWISAVHPISPTWGVGRYHRKAVGRDGGDYLWERIVVAEIREGRLNFTCEFDVDDEEAAFAYAEERARASATRLAVTNRAAEVLVGMDRALSRGDTEVVVDAYREDYRKDDRRRLAGELLRGKAAMRTAIDRMLLQFNHFQWRTLAVRGQGLVMGWTRWSDDSGNMSTYLVVVEVDDDDRIIYEGRFDEDDFESAYYELERRYCAGEGAGFADYGVTMATYFAAKNRADFDTLFNLLSTADFSIESRSHALSWPTRSAAEFRGSLEQLMGLVDSFREWLTAVLWVAPDRLVGRFQREGLGRDGEDYAWERFVVAEFRGGRLAFVCDFDVDDEVAAFAYAEERARASATRLAVTNRAAEVLAGIVRAFLRGDAEVVVDAYREDCCHDDRRRLAGGLLPGRAELRAAVDRILQQFNDFQWRTLAVRGQGLAMGWTRWSDDSGNMSTYLHVVEVDDNDRIIYEGWFDEDDFEAAYHELDRRFYAGEGAVFADNESLQVDFMDAVNRLDLEVAQELCIPTFRLVSPPTTLAMEDRSLKEFFNWVAERAGQAPSVRHWMSVKRWVSVNCLVSRLEIRSIGPDGDEYTWPRIAVSEMCGGLLVGIRQFDIDDEESAFAYADTIIARQASRLPSTNLASEVGETSVRVMNTGDVDAILDFFSEPFDFDDHRRLSGDPIIGKTALRAAMGRILSQYTNFEPTKLLAVRGTRLMLGATRWSDAAGNETAHLHVIETGEDGRIVYEGRFDEDDFEGAYAELERRYYAGEGEAFAENGLVAANYVTVMNRGDFGTMIKELTRPDFRLENRSLRR